MLELITQNLPLIAAFLAGTLLPFVIENFYVFFFQIPDKFLNSVNTTLVPRFGDNGGKIVLITTQLAVMLIKQIGKTLIWLTKTVFPFFLSAFFQVMEIMESILRGLMPIGSAIGTFVQSLWQELLLFVSWTKEAISSQFVKFLFHILLLYGSVHLLVFCLKRMMKKIV